MAANQDQDPPPNVDFSQPPESEHRLGVSNDEDLGPLPQYTRSISSSRFDSDAASIVTLPPSYTAAISDGAGTDADRLNGSVTGKSSGRYHGVKYDLDDLWKAAMQRNTGILQRCFKAGLNVNYCRWIKNEPGLGSGMRSIADVAANKNDIPAMRILIENKVDLTGSAVSVAAVNRRGEATYVFANSEFELLDNDLWSTPLHEACKMGNVNMVSLLLDEGRVNPHVVDARQRTGLFAATKARQTRIVQLLLANGAAIESENVGGVTPLASAAYAGSTDIVELLLLNDAQVDVADDRGETAFYNASLRSHHEIMTMLISFGADVNVRNLAGVSAFFTAASNFKTDTMDVLIQCGADTDVPDENGCTALLRAVMAQNIPLTRHILSLGAGVDAPDDRGWTPLFAAMIHKHDEIIRLLLDGGCDIIKGDLHGNTPLHQAAMLGSTTVLRHVLAASSHNSTNLTLMNMFGETPLALACKYNNSPAVRLLLKHGSDPHHVDSDGYRALDRAMYHGNFACVRLLLEAEARLDDKALSALQQGDFDRSDSGSNSSTSKVTEGYRMIMARLRTRHDVSQLPKAAPTSQLRELFAQAITLDDLRVRMRSKQKRNTTIEPNPPAHSRALSVNGHPNGRGSSASSSSDPFEACIPKPAGASSVTNGFYDPHGGSSRTKSHGSHAFRAGNAVAAAAVTISSSSC